jgi:hypothetical protein
VFLTLLVSSVTTGWISVRVRAWVVPRQMWGIVAAAAVGLPVGFLLQHGLSQEHLRLLVSTMAAVCAALLLMSLRTTIAGSSLGAGVIGLVSGLLQTSASLGGPPVALYLLARGWNRSEFKLMMTAFLLWTGVSAAAIQAVWGGHSGRLWWVALAAFPFVLLGSRLGEALLQRVDPTVFRWAVFALVSGAALQAFLRLWTP